MTLDVDHSRLRGTALTEPVDGVMSTSVAAVHESDDVWGVLQRFQLCGLRHIVVLDEAEQFVSVLNDRLAADQVGRDRRELELLRVRDVVFDRHTFVVTGTPLQDAAREMLRHSAGALAIVDSDRHVLGVVTGADVLRSLVASADEWVS